MVSHFDCEHSSLIEKNVIIVFILPSRWKDGAESQGKETTGCLCYQLSRLSNLAHIWVYSIFLYKLFGISLSEKMKFVSSPGQDDISKTGQLWHRVIVRFQLLLFGCQWLEENKISWYGVEWH